MIFIASQDITFITSSGLPSPPPAYSSNPLASTSSLLRSPCIDPQLLQLDQLNLLQDVGMEEADGRDDDSEDQRGA